MPQPYYQSGNAYERKKRLQTLAWLYFDEWTVEELAEETGYSIKNIQRDIQYIEAHREEFIG